MGRVVGPEGANLGFPGRVQAIHSPGILAVSEQGSPGSHVSFIPQTLASMPTA